MKKIYFATTNEGKLREAINLLGMDVQGVSLDIDEVQSLDPVEVAVKKAESYFRKVKKPLFVEDVSLTIKVMNNLPGPYIDSFMKSLGNDGILNLLKGRRNRNAVVQTTVVYADRNGKTHEFTGVVKGKISENVRGDKGFGWDPIFIPEGARKTFAEMDINEKNNYSMRAKALIKFKEWLSKNEK